MKDSPIEEYDKLANRTISLEDDPDWKKTDALIEHQVIKDGTHAYASDNTNIINKYPHLEEKYNTHWYRGTDTVMSEYPYSNWVIKKKCPLSEDLMMHMLLFQQVTIKYVLYLLNKSY